MKTKAKSALTFFAIAQPRSLYAHHQRFHGQLRQRAEAELPAHLLRSALIQPREEYGETAK
jgi:hypothetical protein